MPSTESRDANPANTTPITIPSHHKSKDPHPSGRGFLNQEDFYSSALPSGAPWQILMDCPSQHNYPFGIEMIEVFTLLTSVPVI
jgi:hypothetical protein